MMEQPPNGERKNNYACDWSGVVLSGAILMAITSEGIRSCFGVFYSQFIDTFHLSPPQAATIGSLLNAAFYFPGPLAAVLIHKLGARCTALIGALLTSTGLIASSFVYSYWSILFTFGILTGFGLCLTFLSTMGALPHWFTKKRPLAMAMCTTFGACGTFIFPSLIQTLIDIYTWRGATVILGGLALQSAISAMTLFPPSNSLHPISSKPSPSALSQKSQMKYLFTDPSFVFHCISVVFMFAFHLCAIFIVRHVVESRGMTAQHGAALVGLGGLCNCAGRILVMVMNFYKHTATQLIRFMLFNFSTLFAGLFYAAIPWFWRFDSLLVICAVAGFMQGVKYCTMSIVTIDVTTPERFQTGYGFVRLFSGASMLFGSPFAGYLAALMGTYDVVFYFAGLCLILSFVAGMVCFYWQQRKNRRNCSPESGVNG